MPWQPGLAVLQCDIHVEGEPWPYTPRLILKGMLEKARERGFVYNVGCEAEYFLVRRARRAAASRWPTRSTAPARPATTPRA